MTTREEKSVKSLHILAIKKLQHLKNKVIDFFRRKNLGTTIPKPLQRSKYSSGKSQFPPIRTYFVRKSLTKKGLLVESSSENVCNMYYRVFIKDLQI